MEDAGVFIHMDFISRFSFNKKHIWFEVSKVQFIQFLFLAIPRLQFHQRQYKDLYPIQLACNFNWLNGKLWKRLWNAKILLSSQSRISERRFGGQETLNHQSEGLPLILRVRICAFRKYFDVSITVPIVIMFLHGCERILHKQQLYIFGLLSGDCSNDSSLRETGFLQTALDPSSVRVNFSNLEEYGDFPPYAWWHSHGIRPTLWAPSSV